jgi:methyl-accepting chemotaxis protein
MNIANIKIGHRLTIAFSLTTVMLAVVVALGATCLRMSGSEIALTVQQRYHTISRLNAIRDQLQQQALDMRDALLLDDLDAAKGAAGDEALPVLEASDLLADAQRARDAYAPARDSFLAQLRAGDKDAAGKTLAASLRPAQAAYQAALDKLVAELAEKMGDAGAAAEQLAHTASTVMIALGLVGGLLSLLTAWIITRGIVGPIQHAVRVARTVAGGDLSSVIEVRSRDEIGQLSAALREMNASLVGIVSEVRGGTEAITTASAEIAAGNMDLSGRTERQAGALEETASAMEQLTSTVKQNAQHARQANALAQSASDVAGQGGAVVAEVVDTMASINASARRIVDIIAVIDGIAFQTNILALNAAVEAARAGEQGRGFAVVANEVRGLAQRSAAAAREIAGLIGDSVDQVDAGARLVDQAGSTMNEIVASVRRVTDIMSDIAAASQEQLSGIDHVNQAIAQMDQSTQQNAALVEQASAAAATMLDQAAHLSGAVGVFKLGSREAQHLASVTAMAKQRKAPSRRATPGRALATARQVANGAPERAWDDE